MDSNAPESAFPVLLASFVRPAEVSNLTEAVHTRKVGDEAVHTERANLLCLLPVPDGPGVLGGTRHPE